MENIESISIKLVKPSEEFKKSFIEAMREFQAEGREKYMRLDLVDIEKNFQKFLSKLDREEKGINLEEGRVPQSEFWLVDVGEFVGAVYIRHTLNADLLAQGGHIGYFIRPTKRRMGYGTQALELALPIAKKLGVDKVLITCDDDNVGSAKIIEKSGGVLENKAKNNDGILKRRYWVENK